MIMFQHRLLKKRQRRSQEAGQVALFQLLFMAVATILVVLLLGAEDEWTSTIVCPCWLKTVESFSYSSTTAVTIAATRTARRRRRTLFKGPQFLPELVTPKEKKEQPGSLPSSHHPWWCCSSPGAWTRKYMTPLFYAPTPHHPSSSSPSSSSSCSSSSSSSSKKNQSGEGTSSLFRIPQQASTPVAAKNTKGGGKLPPLSHSILSDSDALPYFPMAHGLLSPETVLRMEQRIVEQQQKQQQEQAVPRAAGSSRQRQRHLQQDKGKNVGEGQRGYSQCHKLNMFLEQYRREGPMACLPFLSDKDVLPGLTEAMRDVL